MTFEAEQTQDTKKRILGDEARKLQERLKQELQLFQRQVSAPGADAVKSAPLSMFFDSLSGFLEQVGGGQTDFKTAYAYAEAIEAQKVGIITGRPGSPLPSLRPELTQVMREVAALANTLLRLEKPNPASVSSGQNQLPALQQAGALSVFSGDDAAIHRYYLILERFLNEYGKKLAVSRVPEDRQLKDYAELALGVAHDHVMEFDAGRRKELEGIWNDILDASEDIATSGGDVNGFPYCHFQHAELLVEAILNQIEAGRPCDSRLAVHLGMEKKQATRPAQQQSPIISELIQRLSR